MSHSASLCSKGISFTANGWHEMGGCCQGMNVWELGELRSLGVNVGVLDVGGRYWPPLPRRPLTRPTNGAWAGDLG